MGLVALVETAKPEWRDPEFGHHLRQIEAWQHEWPDRPLVVVIGSSRTQMGVSPAAMGLPNGPADPLVYNFGYRGAQPIWAWLNLMRLLDRGIKPDFVLVHIALAECGIPHPAEDQFAAWSSRLSGADVRRLQPYTEDTLRLPALWAATRLTGWSRFAECIRSDVLPDWQPRRTRRSYSWEHMDRHGFVPLLRQGIPPESREEVLQRALQRHARSVAGRHVSEITRRAHRDLVDRCAAEGIPVAFAWTPESPRYREAHGRAGAEAVVEYTQFINRELQTDVFPAPLHLEETEFADGYHLLPPGAARYSLWLADTHLRPWLARAKR